MKIGHLTIIRQTPAVMGVSLGRQAKPSWLTMEQVLLHLFESQAKACAGFREAQWTRHIASAIYFNDAEARRAAGDLDTGRGRGGSRS